MNKSDSKQNIKPTVRILSYLTAKIPADRHVLILHGNLLITAGSLIAIIETFIAVSLGLHHVPYTHTIFISIIILSMTTVFTSIPYFKKNLRIWHELALFLIYLLFFLFAFCLWEYRLGELRFLAIINAITSIIILLSYTNIFQSLLISISTLICYYSISWYAIKISGQPGSLQKEAFLSFCLFPAFMLISFAAYYVNKSRIEIQRIKNELESNQTPFQSICAVIGVSGLGKPAQSLSAIRRGAAGALAIAEGRRGRPRSPSYDAIYQPGSVPVQPLTNRTVSRFFELALGLSAWKKAGESEWALRNNPSSGNLHPTEGYVLLPPVEGLDLKPGLYHYAPKRTWAGVTRGLFAGRHLASIGSLSVRSVSVRSHLSPLAGSLEVRRAGISLLQPRCRPCDRVGAYCGGDARLEDGAAGWQPIRTRSRGCWEPIA